VLDVGSRAERAGVRQIDPPGGEEYDFNDWEECRGRVCSYLVAQAAQQGRDEQI
jgi:hypothetical protein